MLWPGDSCIIDSHLWLSFPEHCSQPSPLVCIFIQGVLPAQGVSGIVAQETAHSSKEEEGKAEAEPYGRESRSRHSISVVGAH